MKQFSGRPAQCINRDITRDNHRDGIKNRAIHVFRGGKNYFLQVVFLALAQTQFAINVFDHHQRAVDDDSEIDRANGQQICRHVMRMQENEREQQRQRDRQRHNHRGAYADQKKNQYDQHQRHAQQHVFFDRIDRQLDQIAAVIIRPNLHVWRQDVVVQFLGFRFHALQYILGLIAPQHHDDAFHRIIILVEAKLAQARRMPDRYVAHITHMHRHAVLRTDNHAANVRFVLDQSQPADVIKLPALRIKSAAGIRVVHG